MSFDIKKYTSKKGFLDTRITNDLNDDIRCMSDPSYKDLGVGFLQSLRSLQIILFQYYCAVY
jgi:hypothetical protein